MNRNKTNYIKYLEVVIDCKLKWEKHIQNIKNLRYFLNLNILVLS